MRIDEIDKNLAVDKSIDKSGLKFFSFEDEPFRIYGDLRREDNGFLYRIPRAVAEKTSRRVAGLAGCTAGGRVKFKTDSKRIAIIARYRDIHTMSHFPITGSIGLDLYADNCYKATFTPPVSMPNMAYESLATFDCSAEREITVNLPSYSMLNELYIGIDEGATLSAPTPYKNEKPIVYYGSSITQGACSSRPGATYQSRLARWLDWDYINLGFSGSAYAEEAIIDYIASLDMSVFVCDYDHNAKTLEYLEATHMPIYRKIRAKQPELPIIFMTRPNSKFSENRLLRRAIIKKTYDTAISEGDKNVYFLDPTECMPLIADDATVDSCHPTDLGFYFIASALRPILEKIIKGI